MDEDGDEEKDEEGYYFELRSMPTPPPSARTPIPYKPLEHTDFIFPVVDEGNLLLVVLTLAVAGAVAIFWLRSRKDRLKL